MWKVHTPQELLEVTAIVYVSRLMLLRGSILMQFSWRNLAEIADLADITQRCVVVFRDRKLGTHYSMSAH